MPTARVPAQSDDTESFYATLPEITTFADVTRLERYAAAPPSSLIVMTDVPGSTSAIERGRYRDVNAVGVASIVAVCNAMRDIEIPFVFGGDGATLLVPATRRAAAERALRGVRALAEGAFALALRAAIVPLADLLAEGHVARIARFRASTHARLAMFSGTAWPAADAWMKDPARAARYEVSTDGDSDASFDGFECRWKPVRSRRGETVTLIVRALATDEVARKDTYRRLLAAFDDIVDARTAHPVTVGAMQMTSAFGDFSVEGRIRSRSRAAADVRAATSHARKQALLGRLLIATGRKAGDFDGATYLREFVENCDVRKFDDSLRLVADLAPREIVELERLLARERAARGIAYGLHRSPAALVTCLVRSYSGDHVHFVDGANGGYALAARALKKQLTED